jgi:peptidoglycan biosynthesis protein MviN/MurJ (putative lipid II flippase)
VIALLFQRGNFTAESTRLVSGAFLGFAPAIIGWSLLELTSRSLFALNRPWIPLCAASVPVIFNLLFSAGLRARGLGNAEFIGLGASLGLLLGFGVLSVMGHLRRKHWHDEALPQPESQPEELVLAQ